MTPACWIAVALLGLFSVAAWGLFGWAAGRAKGWEDVARELADRLADEETRP